jgi:hypothetical protein
MRKILAFINGAKEFRLSFTTHYTDYSLAKTYDHGRAWAHRLTFNYFD